MKKAFSFLILIFISMNSSLLCQEQFTTQPNRAENIQVLLAKSIDEALLEVKGSHVIFNPQDGTRISSSMSAKRFMVRATASGIKWGGEYPGIHQIYVVPKSKNASILINGIEYDGAVAIFKIKNKINILC